MQIVTQLLTFVECMFVIFDVAAIISQESVEATAGGSKISRMITDVPFPYEMSGVSESTKIFR